MIDTNNIEVDITVMEKLVSDYIDAHFDPNATDESYDNDKKSATSIRYCFEETCFAERFTTWNVDKVDFIKHLRQSNDESFSEMLQRLIEESGEKNSTIYTRANIDRRHFSKIIKHEDYQPTKQTVLAFAIALKLGFDKTKALLAAAGFAFSNANLFDVIVSAFIENKIFNVLLVNEILYKYNQPLLGG